ncbi:hypothetical protein SNE40_022417 [Patella caerulea]|uniref:Uncharacterized protein n=1 Tax=Patella caerulea TaxID=87958 RepID=A0AAN8IZL6_PATCE
MIEKHGFETSDCPWTSNELGFYNLHADTTINDFHLSNSSADWSSVALTNSSHQSDCPSNELGFYNPESDRTMNAGGAVGGGGGAVGGGKWRIPDDEVLQIDSVRRLMLNTK